jgi:hypothetical protein
MPTGTGGCSFFLIEKSPKATLFLKTYAVTRDNSNTFCKEWM